MENFVLTISFLLMGMGLRRLPHFPKDTAQVLNLFAITLSLPPMVSAGALAIMAGLSPRLTAALIGLGIMLSFFTLPLLFRLL